MFSLEIADIWQRVSGYQCLSKLSLVQLGHGCSLGSVREISVAAAWLVAERSAMQCDQDS